MKKDQTTTIGWTEEDVELCLNETKGVDEGPGCCETNHYTIETPEQFQMFLKALNEANEE